MRFILDFTPVKCASALLPEDKFEVAEFIVKLLEELHKKKHRTYDAAVWAKECPGNYYWLASLAVNLSSQHDTSDLWSRSTSLRLQHLPGQTGSYFTQPSRRVVEENRIFYSSLRRGYAVNDAASAPGWLVRLAAVVPASRPSQKSLFGPLSFRPYSSDNAGSQVSEWTENLR